ncbi:tripartite tricarboxylate transporter substrate binding protein [Brevibacillus composti]|uniref:Tripartite tricarboxylate transporter substrate binding protein n=1 Tax=Brevibacillus composti TaxID=2796470 RepID=A0A7T5EMI3_9BACL|nr:tripartite tricarboxylate transporter substrate binding protein [Brevibacillus composti]QQE75348.1 tripartite tricarboxylate transporter substrate binding protein [Brevibacillus composti]QUO42374.1 tripartite tricarboxylate transporter substrate binding protein [Brevibacillus composti]
MKAYQIWSRFLLSLLAVLVAAACGAGGSQPQPQTAPADASPASASPSAAADQGATKTEPAYPVRQIEYIVPYSAGGGVDLVARAAADYLSKEWGQPIAVINKPGGGGTVGAEYALKQAKPDGYTVLAVNVSNTSMLAAGMAEPLIKNDDQIYTARIGKGTMAFAVKEDAAWSDFASFSEWARANPDALTWTSVGPAGFSAFGVAEWLDRIGGDYVKTRMIVTKGASDSVPKVAGGHAVLAIHTVGEINPMLQAKKVKVLAVGGEERSPFLPDVPTAAEQGIEGLSVFWWTGVSFPKGTPEGVIKKWEAAVAKMTSDPDFVKKLHDIQVEPAYADSAQFTQDVEKETQYYTELAEKTGIRN